MKSFICGLLAALVIGAVMGYVGNGDFEEATQQQADYCERVRTDVHSDYKELCLKEITK